MALSIQYQLAAPLPSTTPTPATSPSSLLSSVSAPADYAILFLLESSASQLESNCLIHESQLQLCECLHTIKANLATCERHNLLLATISHKCKADNFRLKSLLSSCHAEISRLSAEHDTLVPLLDAQPARSLPPPNVMISCPMSDQPTKYFADLIESMPPEPSQDTAMPCPRMDPVSAAPDRHTDDPSRVRGGNYSVKIQDPLQAPVGCSNSICLDPETV